MSLPENPPVLVPPIVVSAASPSGKVTKFFSEMQVGTAAFLASPFAGGILMAQNAKRAGQGWRKYFYLGVSLVATVVLMVLSYLLPDAKSGNILVPLAIGWAYRLWYRKAQGDLLTDGGFPDAKRRSWWAVVGISLLVILILLALLVGFVLLFSDAGS